MRMAICAALALVSLSPSVAQSIPDLGTATPIAGNWTYAQATEGSEAVFTNASGYPQLWIHCTRATRRVSIAVPAAAAVPPFLNIWTSSATRSVASSFNAATGRLSLDLANYDPLLDAIASSRGRIGFSVGGQTALVVPAWPEVARVIEDCRA